jgi:two-component system sensor histidine kinase KdpD
MLDRAHQMVDAGVNVVAALVETHGRADTARLIDGLEVLPRKRIESVGIVYEELDVNALLSRRPLVALIDELAHSNAPGSTRTKRYLDVLTVIRAGISVMTTLNIQHLEGLNDVVRRLTGVTVRETIADGVLEYADEVVLIDASPQTLRDRLRAGKIYPRERVDAALSSFFQVDNLSALRELALREALRVRRPAPKGMARVGDLLLGVAPRERDVSLIHRAARLADRLGVDLHVLHVAKPRHARDPVVSVLEAAAVAVRADWAVAVAERPYEELARRGRDMRAVVVVEGARARPGLLAGPTVARRVLDAGAHELLVLAPVASAIKGE